MRATIWVAAALGIATAMPSHAVGTPGPFAGIVKQGQTKTHYYSNNPANFDCIQLATTYTVSLRYAPPSDTLTLNAGGVSVVGGNGSASVSFMSGVCTSFTISVRGTSVADTAGYTLSVNSGNSGSAS